MRRLLSASLLLSLLALPASGHAAIQRCTDANGITVFTDRSCASQNAVPKGAPAEPGGGYATGFAPRGCARTPGDLAMGVRTALEARDVNRLASFYHWTGTGSGGGRRVMDALEAIANRPLVSVELAYPAEPAPFDPLLEFGPDAAPSEESAPLDDAPPPTSPRPIGLDLRQMASDTSAGSRSTRFRLQRNAGCWWLAL